jgi:protein involved in polysaccharide export with SLBB domain
MSKFSLLPVIVLWTSATLAAMAQPAGSLQPLAPPPESASDQAKQPTGDGSADAASSTASPENANAGASRKAPLMAATLTSMDALDGQNHLDIGDTISFRVIEDRDNPVTRVVTDTGEVDFPYVGRLKVKGKTCRDVALELKKLLEVDYYKRATVIIGLDVIAGDDKSKPHSFVWITGEVRQQGPQELSKIQPVTVSQAIMRAGGFTDYANQKSIRVFHHPELSSASSTDAPLPDSGKSGEAQVVNIKAIMTGNSSFDPVVQPGDYIIVSRSLF